MTHGTSGRAGTTPVPAALIVMLSLAWSLGLSGCGRSGPDIARVQGVVTLDGTPLPEAFIFFRHAEGGRVSQALTDENGQFQLIYSANEMGAIVGSNSVRISTYVEPEYTDAGKLIEGTGKPEKVPKKYNKESDLKVDVVPGQNEFAFELTTSG